MKELGTIQLYTSFVFNWKIYVVLRHEGNMTEVKEKDGRHWAWPKQAMVQV